MSRLKEIHDYLISIGKREEDLLKCDHYSVYLSMEIMEYAHRNQKRVNGDDYAVHPTNAFLSYQRMVNMNPNDYFSVDKDLLINFGIPFDGVQEVCLLHDVVEDTDFTIKDIEDIFDECNMGDHFRLYMKDALIKVTHDKDMDYLSYIQIVMQNPIASIVKMMDLQDNLNCLTLDSFNEKNYKRNSNYLGYLYIINSKYKFIENVNLYKKEVCKNR